MNGTVGGGRPRAAWRRLGCARGLCARLCRRRRRVMPEDDKSRESRRRINHPPPPQYSALGERVRTAAPAALQCALFCGGARCQYERPTHRATAIQGLYSDWITDDILAMARPSTASIAARNIIQQFHSWGIRTVINLQTPGEHASCGPPLTASGFTYEPAVFMSNDIYYYNFAWEDYGEASLSGLLDMTKVLAFSIQQGRVAIHCHAGLGRTGVLIACHLVYSLRVRANDAIRLVRRRRPRSVQTSGQILCVQQFEHYFLPQTVLFSSREPHLLTKDKKTAEFTLRQHLHRQRATLHGLEERTFKALPKTVFLLCERLLRLCGCQQSLGLDLRVRSRPFYRRFLAYRIRQARPPDPTTPEDVGINNDVPTLPMLEWRDQVEEEVERSLETVSRITGASNGGHMAAIRIHEAFTVDHHSLPDEKRKYLKELRTDINMRTEAMSRIDEEEDPVILTGLLLEWLEGLKQPVLDREDLSIIVSRGQDVESCISSLPMEDVILLEYLLRFVTRLRPLAATKKVDILKRLLASLSHQTIMITDRCLPTHRDMPRLRDGTCSQAVNFMLRMIVELQRDMIKSGKDDADVMVPARRVKVRAWK
ncbi:protein tyrosine phosphatase domain-containing protein 1 isoform X1 [Plutella xylostella]|uniref:protein tyrosine phosphatase domain-containing protein 1 isoform X1 n=1 Tax=Plutella xylostella TaxID=51655 RepID=UPI0020331047|nr:protein tyrosine phosphatase domain-containing protein 1 isoform X1 [Plutella xylostella]